mmetsp:Transcript_61204/g.142458  ORF Transcript_61204/g.142458 Transcript_61204/m.142458 type:complete len:311 (-) Transcript_61204:83-1015(-)
MGGNSSQLALDAVGQQRLRQQVTQDVSSDGSPTSSISSTSSSWSACADSTLIIFDWDDTLLCSSALDASRDSRQLRELEQTVGSVLRTAMRLGETMIVTNGCGTWVQESSRAYLPGLVPTLENLAILSARAMYEHLHPNDPVSWKRRAFRRVLRRKRAEGYEGLNLVVLGDQSAEMQAAHISAKVFHGPCLIKTVKFVESPSAEQLLGQLRKVAQELGGLVCAENSSSTGLAKRRLPESHGYLEAWASGWKLSLGKDWANLPAVLKPHFDEEDDDDEVPGPQKEPSVCSLFTCTGALHLPLREEIPILSV